MTKNEEIIYANAIDVIDNYTNRIKDKIKKAFENKAVECEGRNPMFIGLANDIACAGMRWAIKDLTPYLASKDNVIELSEKMLHSFQSENKEIDFLLNNEEK